MNVVRVITDYLRSSRAELEKVSWPSRKETVRYSALVMGVSVVVALFFAALDFGLGNVVDAALSARQAETSAPTAPATDVTPTVTPSPVNASPVPGLDITGSSPTIVPVDVKTEETP